MTAAPKDILSKVFGFDEYRPGQEEIIDHVLAGGDGLVIMPTGGGKSMCYQLPALIMPGTAVIVSPLIALMQDQVSALVENGVRATFLNSTLPPDIAGQIEQEFLAGDYDLLYLAPERIMQPRTLAMLQRGQVALIAIDEAHCVSQWGHDFRPEYLQLAQLADAFPGVPRLALTATADQRTRAEIIDRLRLGEGKLFLGGFDRPNIRYTVTERLDPKRQLMAFLAGHEGESGIVYCATRKSVEDYAAFLVSKGLPAVPYHAGLSANMRHANQGRFQRDETVIVVATIAFGMGVDKPDVRFVAHMNLPKSIEAYYQETGRAGRDGEPADAWMCFGLQDMILLRRFIDESDAGDAHKRMEHERLNMLMGFCESADCRRGILLRHFGDNHDGGCGNCDNCISPPETFDATVAAQKALSCAYRAEQRFGVSHLVDVLLGKSTEKVLRFRHEQLSTFGVGAELNERQWKSLFRQMIAAGHCTVDAERYNAVALNAQSHEILRGELTLQARKLARAVPKKRERRKPTGGASAPITAPADLALLDALRAWRREQAAENNRPAFVILHDKTLRELAVTKPTSEAELMKINGIGEAKCLHYGPSLLHVIRTHDDTPT